MSKKVENLAAYYVLRNGNKKLVTGIDSEKPATADIFCYIDHNGRYFKEEIVDQEAYIMALFSEDYGLDVQSELDKAVEIVYMTEQDAKEELSSIKKRESKYYTPEANMEYREKIRVERPRRRLW